MQWKGNVTGLVFSIVFVGSCFTNKFVLSVLKFTFPTLFQGWQAFVGAILLLLSGRLGWVEMSRISRSTALSWLPGSVMFLGSIYSGSRALSHMDIPYFFTLQNASHAVSYLLLRVIHREKMSWSKLISMCIMFLSAINLPLLKPGFDLTTYGWAVCHLSCVGTYRVFRIRFKSLQLSVFDQQYINYMFRGPVCCLGVPSPFFLYISLGLLRKLTAVTLSPLAFQQEPNIPSFTCVFFSLVGEALLVYSDMETKA